MILNTQRPGIASSLLATLVFVFLAGHPARAGAFYGNDTVAAKSGSVVAIFSRTKSGRFLWRGSGFVAKPGVIVSAHDDRRDDGELFVRVEGLEQLLEARPMEASHPSELDVYAVNLPTDGLQPLPLAAGPSSQGDRVVSRALGVGGISEITGSILRILGTSHLEVTFSIDPGAEHFGGPVLAADNTVVGTLTSLHVPGGGYLVVPSASVRARLDGKPERDMSLGDPVTAVDRNPSPLADPPPQPLPPISTAPGTGTMGDLPGVPGFPDEAPKDVDGSKGGRGGNYGSGSGIGTGGGSGSGTGTPGRPPGAPPPPGSAVVKKPRALNNPRPAYTEQARTNGTEGRVFVRITIGVDGRVRSASVSQGLPDGLNEKALEAAYRLEFDPARNAAGEPVESRINVVVDFRISRRAGDVTGVWLAVRAQGQPMVQFHLERTSLIERRGLVIIERGPGIFACVPVVGSYADGLFGATATTVTGSCTYRWAGTLRGEEFDLEEVRTCGASGEQVKRSIGLAKFE